MSRILLRLSLAVLAAPCAFAQAPLTLDQCIQLAQNAPSSAAVARQRTIIARYGVTAARAGLNPLVTLQNSYGYTTPGGEAFEFVALNAVRE